jgi:hypothetical protein
MATKLQAVIHRMSEINKNLDNLSNDGSSVSSLSKLWRQSYLISQEIRNKEEGSKKETEDSSLLVFKRDQN